MANKQNDLLTVWNDDVLNEKNINFLRLPTKPVQFPISPLVEQIIEDLNATFKEIACAGIAANQLGYDRKLFIGMKHDLDKSVSKDTSKNIDDVNPDPENFEIYINPKIDKVNNTSTQIGEEGCLSIPEITLNIERYNEIKVRYYNAEGRAIKKPLKGFISRLFQHELDHLDGRLMFENPMSSITMDNSTHPKLVNKMKELLNYLQE